jgi:hypothetical protein
VRDAFESLLRGDALPELEWTDLLKQVDEFSHRAFDQQDAQASLAIHRLRYRHNATYVSVPWGPPSSLISDWRTMRVRNIIDNSWDRQCRRAFRPWSVELSRLDDDTAFVGWLSDLILNHRSNQEHPLFEFMDREASFDQLREFVFQEAAFDMFFSDLLCLMLAGVHDEGHRELMTNLVGEMFFANHQFIAVPANRHSLLMAAVVS